MNCVKCGRDTAEERVFCDACLAEMENYPVKPGTAIHIPARNPVDEARKTQAKKKPVRSLSEQVLRLKKKVLRLRILVVVLLLLCGTLGVLLGWMSGKVNLQPLLGQNYRTEETIDQTESTEP